MFRSMGWPEIALILAIVLIIFGVGRLPQVGGAIGKGLRMFRKAAKGEDESEEEGKEEPRHKEATTKKASKG